jgi:hypothetical protein
MRARLRRIPHRDSLALLVTGLAAFVAFALLNGPEPRREERPTANVAPETALLPDAFGGPSRGPAPSGAEAGEAADKARADRPASEGVRPKASPTHGGGPRRSEGKTESPVTRLPLAGPEDLRAVAPGLIASASSSLSAGERTGQGIHRVEDAPLPDPTAGDPQATSNGEPAASEPSLSECQHPLLSKAVFDLQVQPEMRGVYEQSLMLAQSVGEIFARGSGDGYFISSGAPGTGEAGALFGQNVLVIVRGRCLSGPSDLIAALSP